MAKVAEPGTDQPQDRDEQEERDEQRDKMLDYQSRLAASRERPAAGFFTIYKSGQGYWTRMGTAAAAAVLALFASYFLAEQLKVRLPATTGPSLIAAIVAGFVAIYAALVWWLMNKPGNADFMIATDSEMKKVNWTSRKELIGSTKVVIVFMFLIAAFLFVVDILFGYFFFGIGVMKTAPF